jgi:hypothetical protein
MGTPRLALEATGVIAVVLAVFVGSAAASSHEANGAEAAKPTVIRLVGTNVILRVDVDKAPPGNSKGDTLFTTNVLTNAVAQLGAPKGAIAGSDAGRTFNAGGVPTTVNILTTLRAGTLRVRGRMRTVGRANVMPVVGRTRTFKGATGTLTVTPIPRAGESSNVYRLRYSATARAVASHG